MTSLTASGTGSSVIVASSASVAIVDGFHIDGGDAQLGGGLDATSSDLLLEDDTFGSDSALSGGGIFCQGPGMELNVGSCVFDGDAATGNGGAHRCGRKPTC